MPHVKPDFQSFVKIKVVGVGGGGGNAVSRMNRLQIKGVDFVAINTDSQDLHQSVAKEKIHIGKNLTRGLGTGMNPELGRQAAEETREEIHEVLKGADMVFITAGLGGGTGSGAAPVVAEIAQELGALTIAVVTKPFFFEGIQRMRVAEAAAQRLAERVDTLIFVPNDRIFNIIDKDTPLHKAFEAIDDVLHQATRGIAELVSLPGIINVDFADVKAIMQNAGTAIIGIGTASGEDRAIAAARQAINSPLLEVSMSGAKGVLFSVAGNDDLKLSEVNEAAKIITEPIDQAARVIFGAYHDERMKKGDIKVIVIATGFDGYKKAEMGSDANAAKKEKEEAVHETLDIALDTDIEDEIEKKEEEPVKQQSSGKKEKPEDPMKDHWDIPAFLRKKR
ncbi:MAG: cell division protein FtsZ [Parcubacteria group bacterium]|nr:cell division protein FtsZ [Parcubacteria group bacterium]